MIKATAQVIEADDVKVRVDLYLTVRECRELVQQLSERWPSSDLSRVLLDVMSKTVQRMEAAHNV